MQRKRNVLKNLKTYLAGAIEALSDDGATWRKQIRSMIKDRGIGLHFYDPTDKNDAYLSEIGDFRQNLRDMKSSHEFAAVSHIMNEVRDWDISAIMHSHFMIVYVDPKVPTWGTVEECVRASDAKKPILAIVEGGVEKTPDWMFTLVKYNEIFPNAQELVDYLERINKGSLGLDNRWILL